jgi:hypothetical protein
MASWYRNLSRKLFMALASAGKYQTVCDCNAHPRWRPGEEYLADELVTHINPNTSELSLYRAKGVKTKDEYVDKVGDEPGVSIHWELICTCEEIGFTPTPAPTPTPDYIPTPTSVTEIPTPTPTPRFRCDDYEEWNPDKVVSQGQVHYQHGERVHWQGKVYQVRDIEGVEKNDVPGISNHWTFLFDCTECMCVPAHYTTWETSEYRTDFDGGIITGFVKNLEFSFDPSEFDVGRGINLKLTLENSNISGEVYIDGVDFPFDGLNLYVQYHDICYYVFAKSANGNTEFTLDVKSFPSVCPTPTPRSEYICGEGFSNVYHTDGKSGSHKPNRGLSAELFEPTGKLFYNDLQITNLNEAMVYASALWKNNVNGDPFGIMVITGKFAMNSNHVVYESPDGTCWKGTIQPFGQNIVMYRVY